MTDFDTRFERFEGLLSFTVNRHILEHMARVREQFDMDLDSVYIWGTLAHLCVIRLMAPGTNGELPAFKHHTHETLQAVRLADLAQVVRMPRETVRRKLYALEKRGKVTRTPGGEWILDLSGVGELEMHFTKETVSRLIATAQALQAILNRAG